MNDLYFNNKSLWEDFGVVMLNGGEQKELKK